MPYPANSAPRPLSTSRPDTYVGRFAPSPSGPLHFGSLVSALASYLHARAAGGQWLVRMEDLDPPREEAGAKEAILSALKAHQLDWDGEVLFQSDRHKAYESTLERLLAQGLAYRCRCTRKDIRTLGGVYDGRCRDRAVSPDEPHAWRLKLFDVPEGHTEPADPYRWTDLFQGPQAQSLRQEVGDPIIKRKDGLFAYQLAVIVDDIEQGITHVIRGMDLLPVSAGQLAAFTLMGGQPPALGHVPVANNALGQKLSKQHHAPPLEPKKAGTNLWYALDFLQQQPPAELQGAAPEVVLEWARAHWQPERIRAREGQAPTAMLTTTTAPVTTDRPEEDKE